MAADLEKVRLKRSLELLLEILVQQQGMLAEAGAAPLAECECRVDDPTVCAACKDWHETVETVRAMTLLSDEEKLMWDRETSWDRHAPTPEMWALARSDALGRLMRLQDADTQGLADAKEAT